MTPSGRGSDPPGAPIYLDEEQAGWAARYLREADALLRAAEASPSEWMARMLLDRAVVKSWLALAKLVSYPDPLALELQRELGSLARSPVAKLAGVYRSALPALRDAKTPFATALRVAQELYGASAELVQHAVRG